MNVKELIKLLQTFDENHHVVVQSIDLLSAQHKETSKKVVGALFNGYCVIVIESD